MSEYPNLTGPIVSSCKRCVFGKVLCKHERPKIIRVVKGARHHEWSSDSIKGPSS